jgi:hypothetical protein
MGSHRFWRQFSFGKKEHIESNCSRLRCQPRSGPQQTPHEINGFSVMPQIDPDEWTKARASVAICRPVSTVFAFICDPHNDGRWLTHVGNVRQLTQGPIGIGSKILQFPILLGAKVEVEWEVTEFVADRHIAARSSAGPIAFRRSYDCEPIGSDAKLTMYVQLHQAAVIPFIAGGAANVLLRKASERALLRLKAVLEADVEGRAAP